MLKVLKWIMWIGGGVVIVLGVLGLNLIAVLCGVLIFGFGSLLALLLNMEEQIQDMKEKMVFLCEKHGWAEEKKPAEELTPEQLGIVMEEERKRRTAAGEAVQQETE